MLCGWRRGLGFKLSTRGGLGFRSNINGEAVGIQGSVTLFVRKIAACRAVGVALGFRRRAEE